MEKPTIVLGAGICGVSTALWLIRSGHKVCLIEKNAPGMGASYGNAGLLAQWGIVPVTEPGLWRKIPRHLLDPMSPLFIRWKYLPKLLPWLTEFLQRANVKHAQETVNALVPLLCDSVEQHKALARGTVAEKCILDSKFSYAYEDFNAFKADAYGWCKKQENNLHPEIFIGKEVQEQEPILGERIKCLAVLNSQGHITNPLEYISKLANIFLELGGQLIQGTVKDFELEDEKISSVITDQGHFECQQLVITAGIWSRELMKKIGLDVPLETERGYHVLFKNPSEMPRNPMMITSGKFAVTPMSTGLRCAGTVEFGGITLGPSKAPIRLLRQRLADFFPKLTYEGTEEWMGFRPTTPDSLPLIGEIKNSGIFTAFGHQHIGITAGPKTGRLIADMISGRTPNIDMAPYDPSRYARPL